MPKPEKTNGEDGKDDTANGGVGISESTAEDIIQKLEVLTTQLGRLDTRMNDFEGQGGRGGHSASGSNQSTNSSLFDISFQEFVNGQYSSFSIRDSPKEVIDRYATLKDQLLKVRLQSDFTLGETFYPAKEVPKRCMNIIRKAGSFLMTSFKLLRRLSEENDISEAGAKLLYTSLLAEIQFLQSEQTVCYWEHSGASQDQVKQYKTIHQNPHITKKEVKSFELASQVVVATTKPNEVSTGRGGGSTNRSFGRGGGRSGGRPWVNRQQGQGRWSGGGGMSSGAGYPYQRERDQYDQLVSSSSAGKP